MKNRKIIPTIFSTNKKEFHEKFRKIAPLSKDIQIDFMDGKFVRGKSIRISQVPNLKKLNKNFEAHLMVFNPEKYISALKRKGFKEIIFHYEATKDKQERVIKKIKSLGLRCFMAINPKTQIERSFPFLDKIDGLLIMGVNPGKEHQSMVGTTPARVREIKKYSPKTIAQIDGGVNLQTAKKLRSAGADILNTGSFVSSSKDPKEALKKLKEIFFIKK